MAGKSSIHLMRRFKHRLGNIGATDLRRGIERYQGRVDGVRLLRHGYYEYYGNAAADLIRPMMGRDVRGGRVAEVHRTEQRRKQKAEGQ
jgi:hypothetical protein